MPGCEGTSAAFLDVLAFNVQLLSSSVLPIITLMPTLMLFYGVLHAGRHVTFGILLTAY